MIIISVSILSAQALQIQDSARTLTAGKPISNYVTPGHPIPVQLQGTTISLTGTGLATATNQVPPATLNLSSDTVTIAPGAIDSSKIFATATQYISGNVFSVDGYIKVASDFHVTVILGLAFPYSHTTDFVYAPSVFPKHKIYVKNTGTTTAHILYNLKGL
jgi:hypothetical protein